MSAKTRSIPKPIRAAQVFLLIAIGIAGYLAFKALTGSQVAGCGPEAGCGKVLSSKWSSILTVPISIPGLLTYLALILITQLMKLRDKSAGFMAATLALAIIFSALWFTGLQIFIIKSFCKFCCITHAVASLASLLILFTIFKNEEVKKEKNVAPQKNKGSKKQRAKQAKQGKPAAAPVIEASGKAARLGFALPALLGLGLVGATVVTQSLGPEKDRSAVLESEYDLITPYRASADQPIQLAYTGGTTIIQDGVLPQLVIGEAREGKDPVLLTYIFDWTCDHCRALHEKLNHLAEESSAYGLEEQFIITYLPGAYESASDTLHRIMYATEKHDAAFYKEIEEKLYSGKVKAMFNPVKNLLIDQYGQEEWSKIAVKYSSPVRRALALAADQGSENELRTNVVIFPQLTSRRSVMSGVPTDSSLKSFLKEAAQQQKSYLDAPPADAPTPALLPANAQPANVDPTKNPNSTKYLPKRNKSQIEFISPRAQRAEGIFLGEIAEMKYTFKNTGTEPLTIFNMKGGCICTYGDPKEWNKPVAPGETGTITAYYNSHGKGAFGIQNRYIWVTSSASNYDKNDPTAARMGNRILLQVPMTDKNGDFLLKDSSGKFFTRKTLANPLSPDAWDPNHMKKK